MPKALALVPLFFATASFSAEPECSEEKARQLAIEHEEIRTFCEMGDHGCRYDVRTPAPVEKEATWAWLVKASIIHSFDEKGQPRFMPEGAIFAHVGKDCVVQEIVGALPGPPRK